MDINFDEHNKFWELRMLRDRVHPFLRLARQVYGGYIGEKLSQNSPDAVWESLKKMGITQIIDLRYDYRFEKFKSRCEEYGIGYYNYPIHNDPDTIANMVENFSSFSELLRNGDFYMQGHHSSYIALCVYWAFSKSPGVYPFELRKEIKQDARLMKRVTSILYAMNKYEEERYGKEPYMPSDYYEKQRARIKDFLESDGPERASFSIFDFTRVNRNETTMYDISINDLGVIGYLYPPKHEFGYWEYDIILRPSVSAKAGTFEEAQIDIARHLCQILPMSIRWAALPESVRMCVSLLRTSLERST